MAGRGSTFAGTSVFLIPLLTMAKEIGCIYYNRGARECYDKYLSDNTFGRVVRAMSVLENVGQ